MSRRPHERRRPAGTEAATIPSQGLAVSVPPERRNGLARTRRHDYAVVVLAERADGVVVSQVYQHLAAAERRVRNTHERGLAASMHLVRLVPVPWTVAADLALEDIGGER